MTEEITLENIRDTILNKLNDIRHLTGIRGLYLPITKAPICYMEHTVFSKLFNEFIK